eukprot:4505823-Prymnesium_polylepis.1
MTDLPWAILHCGGLESYGATWEPAGATPPTDQRRRGHHTREKSHHYSRREASQFSLSNVFIRLMRPNRGAHGAALKEL